VIGITKFDAYPYRWLEFDRVALGRDIAEKENKVVDTVVSKQIRSFLAQQFPLTKNVGDDQSLLGGGLIDSLGVLEVVTFLEREYGIAVLDEDLVPENFGSISSLVRFIEAKKPGSA
jgi:acyl carrier protein